MARYLAHVGKQGLSARSQARVLSALRGFFKYLLREREVRHDPTQQMEGPRLAKRLPVVMSEDEVLRLLAAPRGKKPNAVRDRAMLHTMYGQSLRHAVDFFIEFFALGRTEVHEPHVEAAAQERPHRADVGRDVVDLARDHERRHQQDGRRQARAVLVVPVAPQLVDAVAVHHAERRVLGVGEAPHAQQLEGVLCPHAEAFREGQRGGRSRG